MNTPDQHNFARGLDTSALPAVVDRATWQAELDTLRVREKAHTRAGDAIAAARRRLPMVEVDPSIQLLGPHGPVPLLEVFEGRRQLIVYFHMWHTGQPAEAQCEGCTFSTTHINELSYLNSWTSWSQTGTSASWSAISETVTRSSRPTGPPAAAMK